MPRNRELMRVFKDMNYVEQIGSGMSKILKVYKPSIFDINSSFTTVTFPFDDKPINSKEIASEKNRQKMLNVLSIINEKPEVTTSEIAEILNENHTTTRRRLIIYQEMGLISREGSRKTGKWVINRVVTEQNDDEQ
jgi:predicted HTH transcriptional regulator